MGVAAAVASVTLTATPAEALGPQQSLTSSSFNVSVDNTTGGIYTLKNPSDPYGTNFVLNPDLKPSFNVDDSRWTGDMIFNVKAAGASTGTTEVTGLSDDTRSVTSDGTGVSVAYNGNAANASGIRNFGLTEKYSLAGANRDQLNWSFTLDNTSSSALEFQDVGFPLLMNSVWNAGNQTSIYEQNVARHSFVAQDGSYMYWQRPNGVGPYLVMIPQNGTRLEFKNKARIGEGPFAENDPSWEGVVEYYIHSKNVSAQRAAQAASYLPATSLTLDAGQSKTYGFTFRWAQSYKDLRDVLYDSGVVDAVSYPGMVIPTDTKATLAVRAKAGITSVVGESGKNIGVTSKGLRNGYQIYELTLPTLGANKVTVNYGTNQQSVLQYYATQPVANLINDHANFVATKQQAKTTRGYNGAFLQWDMSRQQLITWDNYPGGGWKQWMAGGSDDLGLSPALYLAQKNLVYPNQTEVSSIDYYINNFVLGYLQNARDSSGARTWQVYRWYDGTDGSPSDKGVWRSYNYMHIANTYYTMYLLKKAYPSLTTSFSAAQYLDMAYQTLNAMYTKIPASNPLGDSAHNLGLMGEQTYPGLLGALQAEGTGGKASTLRTQIAIKRDKMFAQAYPFASEASIDTTGFETSYTLAKLYGNTALADKVQSASVSARGTQPLWYYFGGDNRHMGESWWNLGYEAQLGAWQQQDYLTTYAGTTGADFDAVLNQTYGAYLAGWANINSGQISSATANVGAASWQFQSEGGAGEGSSSYWGFMPQINGWWAWSGEADLGFWGGLRAASTDIVDDDILGLYGYGGDVTLANGTYTITPRDGVRQHFTMYNANKFDVQLDKARYSQASVASTLRDLTLTVQAPTGSTVSPDITLTNLPSGNYAVSVNGAAASKQFTTTGAPITVSLANLPTGATVRIYATSSAALGADLGSSATPTASYTASWNRLSAINDGKTVGVSTDDQTQIWGTYRSSGRPASDSVTYSWPSAVSLKAASVSFWNDTAQTAGDGVALPASWKLEYLDASNTWRPVVLNTGEGYPVNRSGTQSTVGFNPVTTRGLRATFAASQASNGAYAAVAASELDVFSADVTAPAVTTSLTPATATGDNGWYTGPVTASASATSDADGPATVEYSTDGGNTWAAYKPVTMSAEGANTVQFRATDASGNVSAPVSATAKVDTIPPTVALANGPAGTVTYGNVPDNAACTATDATSGLRDCAVAGYSAAVGSHTLKATATDNAGNRGTVSRAYTVAKADQVIRLSAAGSATFGDPDVTVTATATSGLPVDLTASGSCTLSGATLHLIGAGSCVLDAAQAGDDNYNAAPNVETTISVGKAKQAITLATPADMTFGDPDVTVSGTSTSGLPVTYAATGACTVHDASVHVTGAGKCTITASQSGDANYNPADDVVVTFAVAKAAQTVAFAQPADKQFGDPDYTVSASATSGLPVDFSATGTCTVAGGVVSLTGAGTCTLEASQVGSDDYLPAPGVARSITVAKGDQAISLQALNAATFGDPDIDVAASASSGLPVTLAASGACTLTGLALHLTGAGDCVLSASQGGDDNYNAAPVVTRSFSVDKASQSISLTTPTPKTFGEPDFTVSASASSGLPVTLSSVGSCSISGTTVHISGGGPCTLTASQPGNGDYNPADDVNATFTIAPKDQSITFAPIANRLFGDPDFTIAPTASSGLPVSVSAAGTCTVANATVHLTGAGTCSLTAVQAGNGDYNAAVVVTRTFTVAPYTLKGFNQPVDTAAVNTAKAGVTIPLKFEVFRGSVELTALSEVSSLTYATIPVDGSAPTDEIETLANGGAGLRYDATAGQYVYNWKTPATPGSYRVTVRTLDGSRLTADFRLR